MISIVQLGSFFLSLIVVSLGPSHTTHKRRPLFFTSQLSSLFPILQPRDLSVVVGTCAASRANQRNYLERHFTVSGVRDSIDIVSTSQIPRLLFETFFLQGGITHLDLKENNKKKGIPLSTSYQLSSFIYYIFREQQPSVFRSCLYDECPSSTYVLFWFPPFFRLQITASTIRRNITQRLAQLSNLLFTNIFIAFSQPRTNDSAGYCSNTTNARFKVCLNFYCRTPMQPEH